MEKNEKREKKSKRTNWGLGSKHVLRWVYDDHKQKVPQQEPRFAGVKRFHPNEKKKITKRP